MPSPTLSSAQYTQPVAVIGDIHGRADLLDKLLARLPVDMPLLVTGDVCDRGPQTATVIERLSQRRARGVRGNHDEWLIDWVNGAGFDPMALHAVMGGQATLASYGIHSSSPARIEASRHLVPEHHQIWLSHLPIVLDLSVMGQRYWLAHAGIPSTEALPRMALDKVVPYLAEQSPMSLLWAKNDPEEMLPVDRPVIMGHVRRKRPLNTPSVMAIDTGAGMDGGQLTAVILPERRFITVA